MICIRYRGSSTVYLCPFAYLYGGKQFEIYSDKQNSLSKKKGRRKQKSPDKFSELAQQVGTIGSGVKWLASVIDSQEISNKRKSIYDLEMKMVELDEDDRGDNKRIAIICRRMENLHDEIEEHTNKRNKF